jgi:hypothetical protein
MVAAAQGDPKVAEAFCSIWVQPRRDYAKAGLERYRNEMRPGIDLNIVMDLLYGPMYYRLLIAHEPLTLEFADQVTELVLAGILKDQNGQKLSLSLPIG